MDSRGSWQRRRIIYPFTGLGLSAALMLFLSATGRLHRSSHASILAPASAWAPGTEDASDPASPSGRSALDTSEVSSHVHAGDLEALRVASLLQDGAGAAPRSFAEEASEVDPAELAKLLGAARALPEAAADAVEVSLGTAQLGHTKAKDQALVDIAASHQQQSSSGGPHSDLKMSATCCFTELRLLLNVYGAISGWHAEAARC